MNNDESRDPAVIASEHLGRELLQGLIAELEKTPKRWADLSESEQHMAIERMRTAVGKLVEQTMRVLFAGEYPACPATLTSASVRGEIRANLQIARQAISRHDLMDRVGQSVVVLMADPDEYLESMKEVRARQQQPDLFRQDGPDLSGVPEHDASGDPEPESPAEPTPDDPADIDEDNWVVTGNDPGVERNKVTQRERVSTRMLRVQLLAALNGSNQSSERATIIWEDSELHAAPRTEVLKGLMAVDKYVVDATDATIEWPDMLTLRTDLPKE